MDFFEMCAGFSGKWLLKGQTIAIKTLKIDSRDAFVNEKSVFIAVRGTQQDGHKYLEEVYNKGVRCFVVEKKVAIDKFEQASIFQVDNSIEAMQYFAKIKRQQFEYPVIGITGSNGKTIVKEWLSQILAEEFSVVKSPLSHNSQVGVPLSVWLMGPMHNFGVFEAGISKPGEMDKLQSIIQPTLGVLTNIGNAHDAGFESRHEKLIEKLKLFKGVDQLIYRADDAWLHEVVSNYNIRTITWGSENFCDVKVLEKEMLPEGLNVQIEYNGHQSILRFPFSDSASFENLMHCITCLLFMSYPVELIQNKILKLAKVQMRLELKKGNFGNYIIDDSYNHDYYGLTKALDYLDGLRLRKNKIVVLSDFDVSHGYDSSVYSGAIEVINNIPEVDKTITIGKLFMSHGHKFKRTHEHYNNTQEFLEAYHTKSFENALILIKGSRGHRLERIVRLFEEKIHGTVLEINLNAVRNNLNFYKSKLRAGTKLMVMVKALAYGSGGTEISDLLQNQEVDYLGVAYADEGVKLRKMGIELPIMVMNPIEESFSNLLQYHLEPEVYGLDQLLRLVDFLQDRPCTIHLKLDTGMKRLGFEWDKIEDLTKILLQQKNLHVASVFTHLAASDAAEHDAFTKQQVAQFSKGYEKIVALLGYRPLRHVLNSAGIIGFPQFHLDMVRLGIGLYGIEPREGLKQQIEPISQLKTNVSQIKKINKGESVGYNRSAIAEHEMQIATLAIGYADGFNRALSNGVGCVLINGKKARVVGNVCMDMTMVDVTDLEVKEGDEALVFGEALPIQEMAAAMHTIPYEILTSINDRVKRIYYYE